MLEPAPCSVLSTVECTMHLWLRTHRISHLHLRREHETFDPPLFRGNVKSPGFLLQMKPAGVFGVDAKNRQTRSIGEGYAFPTTEINESLNFERATGIPVWYAIPSQDDEGIVWSWIKLHTVVDLGLELEDDLTVIPPKYFGRIATESDLGKLYRSVSRA